MTAATASVPERELDTTGTPAIPFGRLIGVELRKTFDTRAGFWLLVVIGLAELLAIVVALLVGVLNSGVHLTAEDLAQVLMIPMALLVPIFAILTVTSEWGQRTTLTTFALVPARLRVMWVKLVTVLIVAVATIVFSLILGVVGNLVYGALSGDDLVWSLDLSGLGWITLSQILGFLVAFALGMLLLSTPGAIVLYYAAFLLIPTMVYGPLYALFETARDIIPWVDLGYAMTPLMPFGGPGGGGMVMMDGGTSTGMALAHTLVACLIWIGIPLVLGARRVQRTEFK